MIKLLLTFISLLIVGSLSTTPTTNSYIYTVVGQNGLSNSILVVDPFATSPNDYIVYNVSLEYTKGILDILSFDQVEKTILVYSNIGVYQSLISIDYISGNYREIGTANNHLSYSYTPQKLVFIENIVYLPVKEISDDYQQAQILETDFNDQITRFLQLNSPSFSFVDQKLVQGYDPINNKLYIGYGTSYNGVNLIEVNLNLNFNSSGSASDSASADSQVLYDNIEGFTTFEYIFTDNSGQVYIVARDPQFNVIICKFDKDTKQCPTFYNYGQNINNFLAQSYFLSQDRNTFILIGPPTSGNTESLQLVQFEVNNNMAYSLSPVFPNYWNNTNTISEIAIAM